MARYLSEAAANAAGITIVHEPDAQRFAVYRAVEESAKPAELVGEAHYSLPREGVIDFDHTVVDVSLRGTGLSGVLARKALTSEVTSGRNIIASCWFIDGYMHKHPELFA